MAPFNLSDFAVREIKIPQTALIPAKAENFLGKILFAHLIDLWSVFWIAIATKMIFKTAIGSLMMTPQLQDAWELIDFSPMTFTSMLPIGFAYFFCSYFMNHGQTYGMKLMKARIVMAEHSFRDSFRWTIQSFAIFATLGFMAKAFARAVASHDHLWRALVTQKELYAPDVRKMTSEENVTNESYREAA